MLVKPFQVAIPQADWVSLELSFTLEGGHIHQIIGSHGCSGTRRQEECRVRFSVRIRVRARARVRVRVREEMAAEQRGA